LRWVRTKSKKGSVTVGGGFRALNEAYQDGITKDGQEEPWEERRQVMEKRIIREKRRLVKKKNELEKKKTRATQGA